MPNRFTPIQPGVDPSQQMAIINKNFAELDNENVTKIYNGSDGVPRIYIDGSKGIIKVAPAGVDVTKALDTELLFNSAQRTLKIVTSGTYVLNRPANTNVFSQSIPHGLTFTPTVIFNVEQTTSQPGYWYSGSQNLRINYVTGAIGEMPMVTANSSQITFSTIAPTNNGEYPSAKTFTFKYYLLQESAN